MYAHKSTEGTFWSRSVLTGDASTRRVCSNISFLRAAAKRLLLLLDDDDDIYNA